LTPLRSEARRVASTLRTSGLRWTAALVADRLLPFGVLGWWDDVAVDAQRLAAQHTSVLRAWGMSDDHAAVTTDLILYADLHGIDSHGSNMMLAYHRDRLRGTLNMKPEVTLVRDGATTALVDGGGGIGHVAGEHAMRLAIAKCRAQGVAAVAVRNSGHFGAAGAYASMAEAEGLIGFATTSTRAPAVVPTFGVESKLGTNPIALAAPADRTRGFLLDMATSAASLGSITMAWRHGRRIPKGWAMNARGRPLRNARSGALGRRLLPLGSDRQMGSHKGYGLAAAMEILSSVLPGAQDGIGHFFLALDPGQFRDGFAADLDELMDSLRATAPRDADQPVLVAGDPEVQAQEERARDGVPLSRSVFEDLRGIAKAADVPFLLDEDDR
jgi:LDH2 family malate/lactate/ureidoglycolate dehydrogenase